MTFIGRYRGREPDRDLAANREMNGVADSAETEESAPLLNNPASSHGRAG
jgi:hypothetical protein